MKTRKYKCTGFVDMGASAGAGASQERKSKQEKYWRQIHQN